MASKEFNSSLLTNNSDIAQYPSNLSTLTDDLNDYQRSNLSYLSTTLNRHWRLGRNIVLVWSPTTYGLDLIVVPYYLAVPRSTSQIKVTDSEKVSEKHDSHNKESPEVFFKNLITGERFVTEENLNLVARIFKVELLQIKLPFTQIQAMLDQRIIDELVKRFSISYVEDRAVALFDIVGFSLFSSFEQTSQLNSLAYSINSAHSKMLDKEIHIDFARSTTGDGFYLWNRDSTLEGNINLYHLMHLVLADNAIARQKSKGKNTPLLKTAFNIGDCYEFYQTEGLEQTIYSYIVGEVTIELARIIEKAIPGQILVGDFRTSISNTNPKDINTVNIDSMTFIKQLQKNLSNLHGLELSGEEIESIECYLTGEHIRNDEFNISKYQVIDKHQQTRNVFNAKINIYREMGEPIYLGIQENDINNLDKVKSIVK